MLTPRQREVAELVAQGKSTKAIARELGLSPSTVNEHVREAARRLPGNGRQRYKIIIWFLGMEES